MAEFSKDQKHLIRSALIYVMKKPNDYFRKMEDEMQDIIDTLSDEIRGGGYSNRQRDERDTYKKEEPKRKPNFKDDEDEDEEEYDERDELSYRDDEDEDEEDGDDEVEERPRNRRPSNRRYLISDFLNDKKSNRDEDEEQDDEEEEDDFEVSGLFEEFNDDEDSAIGMSMIGLYRSKHGDRGYVPQHKRNGGKHNNNKQHGGNKHHNQNRNTDYNNNSGESKGGYKGKNFDPNYNKNRNRNRY